MALDSLEVLDVQNSTLEIIEGILYEDAKPGMFLELRSDGTWKKNTQVATPIIKAVLLNNPALGETITATRLAGERVRIGIVQSGQLMRVLLKDGQTASVGTKLRLVSGGQVTAAGTDSIIVQSMAAGAPSGSDGLLLVRVIG